MAWRRGLGRSWSQRRGRHRDLFRQDVGVHGGSNEQGVVATCCVESGSCCSGRVKSGNDTWHLTLTVGGKIKTAEEKHASIHPAKMSFQGAPSAEKKVFDQEYRIPLVASIKMQ